MSSGCQVGRRTHASKASTLSTKRAICITSIQSSRQKHQKFFYDSIVSGHKPTESPVGSKSTRVEPTWEKRCNERSRLTVPNFWMFLEKHMNRWVWSRWMAVISRTCWHEIWLRFGQALGPSGWRAFTRPWKPKILSQDDAVTAPFRQPLAVTVSFWGIFSRNSRMSSDRLHSSRRCGGTHSSCPIQCETGTDAIQ